MWKVSTENGVYLLGKPQKYSHNVYTTCRKLYSFRLSEVTVGTNWHLWMQQL